MDSMPKVVKAIDREVNVVTSVWVGPPGGSPRVRVDYGETPFQTRVYFDDVPQRFVVWMAFSASVVTKDMSVLYADMLRTSLQEPNADFVAYLRRAGVRVNVWDIGEKDRERIEAERSAAFSIHELYAKLRRA